MLHAMDQFIVSVSSLLLILISSAFFFHWFGSSKRIAHSMRHLFLLVCFTMAASVWLLLKTIDIEEFPIHLTFLFLMTSLYYGGYQVGLITLFCLQFSQGIYLFQTTDIWHVLGYILTYGLIFYGIVFLKKRMIAQSISFFVLLATSLLIPLPLIYFMESTSHLNETNALRFILINFVAGSLIHVCLEMIRAQYARYHQACQDAGIDTLTGLYNRRKLEESIRDLVKTRNPFSILMLDVDHFKRINDTHGHSQGDAILRQISRLLSEQCPAPIIIGRYGGEEFIIICPDTPMSTSCTLAERVRVASEHHDYQVEGTRLVGITVSIGVAYHEQDFTRNRKPARSHAGCRSSTL
ncbi:GGDEF domain-containing protein [Exiguobacterium sp. SL14]|nr:GGDEF domain-containing protein [Exiguobacterium sp. SL14]MCY1691365.1 GGDEF domain-containing protein [Exiguobacterium sp. SL14]